MKKLFAITLAMTLALSLVGCGKKAKEFVFRNGVTWGMTQVEVLEKEGIGEDDARVNISDDEGNGMAIVSIDGVSFEGRNVQLDYIFSDNALFVAGYSVSFDNSADAETFATSVTKSLTSSYGKQVNKLSDKDIEALGTIFAAPGTSRDEIRQALGSVVRSGWKPSDDSLITLFVDTEYDNSINVLFFGVDRASRLFEAASAKQASDIYPEPNVEPVD